jgi:hypothetical protein
MNLNITHVAISFSVSQASGDCFAALAKTKNKLLSLRAAAAARQSAAVVLMSPSR